MNHFLQSYNNYATSTLVLKFELKVTTFHRNILILTFLVQ